MAKGVRAFLDRHAGGLLPLVRGERDIHVADGVTYTVDVTWARRGFKFSYWTPRYPRWVRRLREAESQRIEANVQARLAALASSENAENRR